MVEPVQLFGVEDGGGLAQTVEIEGLDQLLLGEELLVAVLFHVRAPAQQGDEVDDRVLDVALREQILKAGVAVALAQLAAGVLHDGAQVDVGGLFPAEGLVEQVVLGRGAQVLGAAHDVGDAHQMVVDHVGEVVGGQAVLLDEHVVVQRVAGGLHVAVERVVKAGGAGQGNVLPDDEGLAGLHAAQGLLLGNVQTVLVVLPLLALGGRRVPALLQFFLGAEAGIGRALLHQLQRVGHIQIPPLGLDVGTVIAAHVRAFVIVQPGQTHTLVDHVHRARNLPFLVGILNAQDELAAVLTGEQVGIQGGAQAAQMQVAGGAGSETSTNGHGRAS